MRTSKAILAAILLALPASAQLALDPEAASLELFPSVFELSGDTDVSRVVVVARMNDGTTVDVTELATLTLTDGDAVVEIEGDLLRPRLDGRALLVASWGGCSTEASVTVRSARFTPDVSFARDVIPVLTRQGCNAGGCHGSASGKNGFRLSLFGYDPEGDHERLTREVRGRRVSRSRPERSLLLRKPSLIVPHVGGEMLPADHPHHAVVRSWLEQGARRDETVAGLSMLEVGPAEIVVQGSGRTQRLVVRAVWSDDDDRDVTDLTLLSSSDDNVATIDARGVITSQDPGEAWIMARFGTMAAVCRVLVLAESAPEVDLGELGSSENVVDRFVAAKLRKMRMAPAPRCADEAFIRRVHLDVLNVLPTAARTRAFLASDDPDKRAALVDELLARPEFSDVLAMLWGELLEIRDEVPMRGKAAFAYYEMLRDSFRANVPIDALARRILTAVGSNFSEPAASFFVTNPSPQEAAESAAQVFLGIRIQCAQCHDHPFERWTMDDYYGFAAFFARVGGKVGSDPRTRVVYNRSGGTVKHLRDGSAVSPRHLGGEAVDVAADVDPRVELARWLTAPDNPYFAANVANRLFARFHGRGIIDPVDDVRVSNPASHPALLHALASKLVESGYDQRALVRDLVTSETYQRATAAQGGQAGSFAAASVRRLTAEQIHDALGQVTGVPTKLPGIPYGAPATQSSRAEPNRFLRLFGRPARSSSCACDRRDEPTLGQALNLINGELLQAKFDAKFGRVQKWAAAKRPAGEIIEELFLAAYSRFPADDEKRELAGEIDGAADRASAIADVFWAVLNSKEFLFNH